MAICRQRKEFSSQRKDTLMNLTRENLTAHLNAAAAFSAAAASGQSLQFNLGEISNLLSELKYFLTVVTHVFKLLRSLQ